MLYMQCEPNWRCPMKAVYAVWAQSTLNSASFLGWCICNEIPIAIVPWLLYMQCGMLYMQCDPNRHCPLDAVYTMWAQSALSFRCCICSVNLIGIASIRLYMQCDLIRQCPLEAVYATRYQAALSLGYCICNLIPFGIVSWMLCM